PLALVCLAHCVRPPLRAPRFPPLVPTRRSSDLTSVTGWASWQKATSLPNEPSSGNQPGNIVQLLVGTSRAGVSADSPKVATAGRSEGHTSELQSRANLVCRLLPGKKKRGPSVCD